MRRLISGFSFLTAILVSVAASADPVVIASGDAQWLPGSAMFFHMQSAFSFSDQVVLEGLALGSGSPRSFASGDLVTFQAHLDVVPTVASPETVFNNFYFSAYLVGSMDFVGVPIVAPTGIDGRSASFLTRGTMTGHVDGYTDADGTGTRLFSLDLTGDGDMFGGEFLGSTDSDGRTRWNEVLVPGNGDIEFGPAAVPQTPEPASLILIATGLTAGALRRRRQAS